MAASSFGFMVYVTDYTSSLHSPPPIPDALSCHSERLLKTVFTIEVEGAESAQNLIKVGQIWRFSNTRLKLYKNWCEGRKRGSERLRLLSPAENDRQFEALLRSVN